MFTVIAERINMTRKKIKEKVWERDENFIKEETQKQDKAGGEHCLIDVNAGGDPSKEIDDMRWLAEKVASHTERPLCYDSPNPEVIRAGLDICNRDGTIINSVTDETGKREHVLEMVKQYNTGIIALTMDDNGMAEDLDSRKRIVDSLVTRIEKFGIDLSKVYFDLLVRPAATNPGQVPMILEGIKYVRKQYPAANISLGLSNVSFGIPMRNNLNRAFLAMAISYGCRAAIIDPCEPDMMNAIYSSLALIGEDEYCMNYIQKVRAGEI